MWECLDCVGVDSSWGDVGSCRFRDSECEYIYIYVCLRAEGQLEAAGGIALIAGQALQAAVVVQVAGAGRAHTV